MSKTDVPTNLEAQQRAHPSNVVATLRRQYPSRIVIETRTGRAYLPQPGECAHVGERMWPSLLEEGQR